MNRPLTNSSISTFKELNSIYHSSSPSENLKVDFDHDFLSSKSILPALKPIPSLFLDTSQQKQHQVDRVWFDLANQLDCSNESLDDQVAQSIQKSDILGWDTFDRPICSRPFNPRLIYQTPYPIEESLPVWEAILHSLKLSSSQTIDRSSFTSDFFHQSIGIRSFQLFKDKISDSNQLYPRILGQTDKSTRSILDLSSQALSNFSKIESFIKLYQSRYHCLCSGLIVLIHWLRVQIVDCFENQTLLKYGLVSTSLVLSPIFDLLSALSDLVNTCQQKQEMRQEDVVYQHLHQHIYNQSASLIQVVLSWLLDRVSVRFLLAWQTWLGLDFDSHPKVWSRERDELYEKLWKHCGIKQVVLSNHQDSHQLSTGQLDWLKSTSLSYYFVPEHLPNFFPTYLAKSLFEAGLSLRILRRSHRLHPICLSFPVQKHGQSRWVWSIKELEMIPQALNSQAQEMKLQTAAWRHGIKLQDAMGLFTKTSTSLSQSLISSQVAQTNELSALLDTITNGLCLSDQPASSNYPSRCYGQLIDVLEERLKFCSIENPGLLKGLKIPSLDLIQHLDVLYRFMFCGDVNFNQRLSSALFDQIDPSFQSFRPVGVSTKLMSRGTWPPGGFDLSVALRTVILDSVAAIQSSVASIELEDRLSFLVISSVEEEAGEIYQAESIDGFDFLLIDFKPPAGLGSLLDSRLLPQYQSINKYLMKLLRLQSIMRSTWRAIRPCRPGKPGNVVVDNKVRYYRLLDSLASNSQQILNGLVSFTWEVAIGCNWRAFIGEISRLKKGILQRERWSSTEMDSETEQLVTHSTSSSIDELVHLHRLTLSEIMTCLFLRERQQSFSTLVNQAIFQTIFDLAIHVATPIQDDLSIEVYEQRTREIELISERQTAGVRKLVKSLHLLSKRAADLQRLQRDSIIGGLNRTTSEAGFLRELVLRLDFNSFYVEH
ncbi:hypothetical protein O181_020647 [Austropuccinia psidii MF-1]|uniref:Spindle pole body component n=1 Tax=Austropuccinia psidii MF-1 TaxID=1389203 RepID=A0A9Q3CDW7_9BASI|nr:hypothetical protein [Austropuccinia psidii MF-1]